MAAASRNAHYVLRLVISSASRPLHTRPLPQATRPRLVSTAAVAPAHVAHEATSNPQTSIPTATTSATAARDASATGEETVTLDFLESEGDDYAVAASLLPAIESHDAAPIPWPTIFDHGNAPAKPVQKRSCDLVARLVTQGRYGAARTAHDELVTLPGRFGRVEHRKVYLAPALAALRHATPEGRAECLFWLNYYPNRPATRPHPIVKQQWNPVADLVLNKHLEDPAFVRDFLELAGKKGLLPVMIPRMLLAVTAVYAPDHSREIFERALDSYAAHAMSATSTSVRNKKQRKVVQTHLAEYWNLYLRSLAIVGWNDAARALRSDRPKMIGDWSEYTDRVVKGEGLEVRTQSMQAHADQDAARRRDPFLGFQVMRKLSKESLPVRCNAALDPVKMPSVTELADIQRELLKLARPDMYDAFHDLFTKKQKNDRHSGVGTPTIDYAWWWHATIKRLSEDGQHVEAIATFRKRFVWLGLPRTSIGENDDVDAAESESTSDDEGRRMPTTAVIATTLASIFEVMPPEDVHKYHREFLRTSTTVSPVIYPSKYTHLVCVRPIAHRFGPDGAITAIKDIAATGYEPDIAIWNALAHALVGRGDVAAASDLLDAMVHREVMYGVRLPYPDTYTFRGMVWLCLRFKRSADAKELLRRYEAFIRRTGDRQVVDRLLGPDAYHADSEDLDEETFLSQLVNRQAHLSRVADNKS